ncbi:hypothetical protein G9A89_021161 [Geosiphon pyriformis]|nr:hypothetical protein G9A89_021161 [Geosiphon pyriformis]
MSRPTQATPHSRDFTRYQYFAITLNSPVSNFQSKLATFFPKLEYVGQVGELIDVVEVRIAKEKLKIETNKVEDESVNEFVENSTIRIDEIKKGLEELREVETVEVQIPRIRTKRV